MSSRCNKDSGSFSFFPFSLTLFIYTYLFHSLVEMTNEQQKQGVVGIVGAGLVGALNAIYFAQRGWKVELYELRPGKK